MANEMVALILAGGKGTRLEGLTRKTSKPAVYFGGKYRIIDFVLSSLANSGVTKVGVLTQYESIELSNYCASGHHWGFDGNNTSFSILAPRQKQEGNYWYDGTADAIYQNLDYLDSLDPEYVLILSADHIYKMDYEKMLAFAKNKDADCVIACLTVEEKDVSRFGILTLDENSLVTSFIEKPKSSPSRDASMGVYIFKYKTLKDALIKDAKNPDSHKDFGKDIIPFLLNKKKGVYGYPFKGYWRDVGTLTSLWEANMDLLDNDEALDLYNHLSKFKIYSEDSRTFPQYVGENAKITSSLVNQGSGVLGSVEHSILSTGCFIDEGASIKDCVIMPYAYVGKNVHLDHCIVQSAAHIDDNTSYQGEADHIILVNK